MRQYGLSKMEFSDISDDHLDRQIKEITQEFPHSPEGLVKQLLLVRNIKVQRWRLRDSLHIGLIVRVLPKDREEGCTEEHIMFKVQTIFGILTQTTNLLVGTSLLLEVLMVSVVCLLCCGGIGGRGFSRWQCVNYTSISMLAIIIITCLQPLGTRP